LLLRRRNLRRRPRFLLRNCLCRCFLNRRFLRLQPCGLLATLPPSATAGAAAHRGERRAEPLCLGLLHARRRHEPVQILGVRIEQIG